MRLKLTPDHNNSIGFAKHSLGEEFKAMPDILDLHPELLDWMEADLYPKPVLDPGSHGMSVELM